MSIASELRDLVVKWGGSPTKDDDSIEELISVLKKLDAPSGGSSGIGSSDLFIARFNFAGSDITCDKTFGEIVDAVMSGKIVIGTTLGISTITVLPNDDIVVFVFSFEGEEIGFAIGEDDSIMPVQIPWSGGGGPNGIFATVENQGWVYGDLYQAFFNNDVGENPIYVYTYDSGGPSFCTAVSVNAVYSYDDAISENPGTEYVVPGSPGIEYFKIVFLNFEQVNETTLELVVYKAYNDHCEVSTSSLDFASLLSIIT